MKKMLFGAFFALLFVVLPHAGGAFACDFCLISQGISPLETVKGAGIRVNQRYARVDRVYRGTGREENPGAREEFWTTEFTGFRSVSDDLMLMAVLPYKKNVMDGELVVNPDGSLGADPMTGEENGIGDVALIGRYRLHEGHTLDATSTAAAVFGLKLPTGKTDGRASDGMYLDGHMQLGTGSTDLLVGLSCNRAAGKLSVAANLLATLTGEGRAGETDHRFGNALNYDATAKYRVSPAAAGPAGGPQVFLALGVNGELRDKERTAGVKDPNSGGHTLYLSPGVRVVAGPNLVLELSYQHPVYHDLYGAQLGEGYKANGAVTYTF